MHVCVQVSELACAFTCTCLKNAIIETDFSSAWRSPIKQGMVVSELRIPLVSLLSARIKSCASMSSISDGLRGSS